MKKISILILSLILFYSVSYAQETGYISYQAVVRNSSGALAKNKTIAVQLSILQGVDTSNTVYTEQHLTNTNSNGLITLAIGSGTSNDTLSKINWANGPFFIKTEVDLAGGTNYRISGINQLLSVPYALHAYSAQTVSDVNLEIAKTITYEDIQRWNNEPSKDTIIQIISKSDTIYSASDTLVIHTITSKSDTIYSFSIDTIIKAIDTLYVYNETVHKDTSFFYYNSKDTLVIATDTLVINNIEVHKDTIYSFSKDTLVFQHKDSVFIYSVTSQIDTLVVATDTLVLIKSDEAFLNSPANTITNENIQNWNNKLDTFDEKDPLFTAWDKNYGDLTNAPVIPTKVSDLENDKGYLTSEADADSLNEIQDLSLNGNILIITKNGKATEIDLSKYLDNTDTQLTEEEVDKMVSNNGYLTTEGDADPVNEIQTLSIAGNTISLTFGGNVDLPLGFDGKYTSLTGVPTNIDTDKTDDVTLAGGQTITGVKTFTGGIVSNVTGNLTGSVNANNTRITNVSSPTNANDAATKAYVDALEAKVNALMTYINNNAGPFITDIEGNMYKTITLGTQVWMAENLNSTKLNDNTPIPYLSVDADWKNTTAPARTPNTTGMLYNGYVAVSGKICPTGWHVSTNADWNTLALYLKDNGYGNPSGSTAVAYSIASKTGWTGTTTLLGAPANNTLLNNSTNFNGYPDGMRFDGGGAIVQTGIEAFWWTSDMMSADSPFYRKLRNSYSGITEGYANYHYGMHIRCVKN